MKEGQNMKSMVHGRTPEEKNAAMEWLKTVAADKSNPHSTHATIIQKLLAFYVKTCGDVE
jgi:hypothetical protein